MNFIKKACENIAIFALFRLIFFQFHDANHLFVRLSQ